MNSKEVAALIARITLLSDREKADVLMDVLDKLQRSGRAPDYLVDANDAAAEEADV